MTTCGQTTLAVLAGTKSASSVPFHFIKNNNSPVVSEAPIIFSASRPLSNPVLPVVIYEMSLFLVVLSTLPSSSLVFFAFVVELSEEFEIARFFALFSDLFS